MAVAAAGAAGQVDLHSSRVLFDCGQARVKAKPQNQSSNQEETKVKGRRRLEEGQAGSL